MEKIVKELSDYSNVRWRGFSFSRSAGRAKSVNLGNLFAFGGGRGTANCSNYSKLRRLFGELLLLLEATQGDLRWLGLSQSERKERLDFISIRTKRTFSFFLNQIVKDFSDLSQSERKERLDFISIRTKRTFRFFLNQIVKDFSDLSQSELKELSDTLFQSELKERLVFFSIRL